MKPDCDSAAFARKFSITSRCPDILSPILTLDDRVSPTDLSLKKAESACAAFDIRMKDASNMNCPNRSLTFRDPPFPCEKKEQK
jgi:hypothetical protein